MTLMTQAEYARHCGVTPKTVSIWKSDPRGFLVWRSRKKIKYIHTEASDKGREAHQDPAKKKGARVDDQVPGGDLKEHDYKTARTWVERYKAANQKLQYEIKVGKYILKEDVGRDNFKAGRIFRDALLNIGPRIAPILAAENNEHKILEILKAEHTGVLKEIIKSLEKIRGKAC